MGSPQFLNPALIADSVPQPQPVQNPINLAEGVQRVQQLQQENQLLPQRVAQAQAQTALTQAQTAELQQRNRDQQAFGDAMKNSGGDPDKLEAMAAQTITDPWTLSRVQATASMIRLRNSQMTAAQHNAEAEMSGQFADRIQAVLNAKDPATKTGLMQQLINDATSTKDPVTGKPYLPPGSLDPTAPPSDQALADMQRSLRASQTNNLNQAKVKAEAAEAATRTATALTARANEERGEIANSFQGVATPEDFAAWKQGIREKYPDRYAEYANLAYDPDNNQNDIERMALGPAGRAKADYQQGVVDARQTAADAAKARAAVYGGRAGLVIRATDPNTPPDQRAALQAEIDRFDSATGGQRNLQQRYQDKMRVNDQNLFAKVEGQKQTEQGMAARIGAVLRSAGIAENTTDAGELGQNVTVAGKQMTAGEAIAALNASRGKVAGYMAQQDQIQKRNQWGKHAPQGVPAPATPAAPAKVVTPSAPAGGGAPTSKTFPRSRLHDYAQKSGSTDAQAEAYLTSQGYTVTQ